MFRLLHHDEDGILRFSEFTKNVDSVPPYAILSHTWDLDNSKEVTFEDIKNHRANLKPGYHKIEFCQQRATAAHLEYFWIDTCCINKSDSSELQEAIRSMFRWYREAAVCYVYLTDVSKTNSEAAEEPCRTSWEADFRESRWFQRGWTLQELLAPRLVVFYSSQHKKIGDKVSLASIIREVTHIPLSALYGYELHHFSPDEIMTWREQRRTGRDEDAAYCLIGIFDVSMFLQYGEGRETALMRLLNTIKSPSPQGIFMKLSSSHIMR
jgi:hypothetical protein